MFTGVATVLLFSKYGQTTTTDTASAELQTPTTDTAIAELQTPTTDTAIEEC